MGAFLLGEEQLVGSSTENNELRTAHKESPGHALFPLYGGAIIENILEKLTRFDIRRTFSHIAPPGARKFADVLARFMIADMGSGPLGAY